MNVPLYKHDCEHCTYIRTDKDDCGTIADIYVCGETITFRYSDEGSDNRSISFNEDKKQRDWFVEWNPYAYQILCDFKESISK